VLAGGAHVSRRSASNRARPLAALRERRPDLIISDYSLPDMDGLKALQIAREFRPRHPVHLVSGTIGEEAGD